MKPLLQRPSSFGRIGIRKLQERTVPLSDITESISSFIQLYSSCRVQSNSYKMVRQRKLQPPIPDTYKNNFDGAMFTESEEVGKTISTRSSICHMLIYFSIKT